MSFKCPKENCGIELDTEGGLKRHMTRIHGPYSAQDLRDAGIAPTRNDVARTLDSGHSSIDSVVASAPDTETSDKDKKPGRESKESKIKAAEIAEFDRLRPQLIKRWKRRLRIPFSMWARLADDPEIALSEDELNEGAEMHVDFCQAMGWLRAGKIEAVMDMTFWWGATALSRSQAGKELLQNFGNPTIQKESKVVQ